jgi:protein KRI1
VGKGFKNSSNISELLDEDWDPEKYEREMASQFNDEYYDENDEDFAPPDNSDLLNEDFDYPEEGDEEGVDEEQEAYAEYEEGEGEEEEDNYEQQIEEALYKYDYEDVVAGMPCRFKYRQVEKEDFGLSIDDILDADDAALNKFVGLKAIVGYSDTPHDSYGDGVPAAGVSDRQLKNQKKLEKKRKQLLKALNEKRREEQEQEEQKKNKKKTVTATTTTSSVSEKREEKKTKEAPIEIKTKRKRRRKEGEKKEEGVERDGGSVVARVDDVVDVSESREDVTLSEPAKKKKRKEFKAKPVSAAKKRMDLYN